MLKCISAYIWPCYGIFLIFCGCSHPATTTAKVYVSAENGVYTLYRNGAPFIVKGGSGYTNMAKLRAIGGNTIRTWDTAHLGAILDEAQANHLAVIAGLYMPESRYLDYFYCNQQKTTAQYAAYRQVIQRYRSHPALLMWCLGNEIDFPYNPGYQPVYKVYNRLTAMIHTEDPDHPVTTALINFQPRNIANIRMKVQGIDIISFNTFGDIKTLRQKLNTYRWLWSGPFLVLEWGMYSPQEARLTAWGAPIENTSTKKAEQYADLYQHYLPSDNPRFLGALTFYWGQKEEVTPTWYSIFDSSGATTGIAGEMQALWTGHPPTYQAPALAYMLVNGKGAADNIFMEPGTHQAASLVMQDSSATGLRVVWEVLEEDIDPQNNQRPAECPVNINAENVYNINFRAPQKEGPYRLYARIYDQYGNMATANTPFYVAGKKI